MSIGTTPRHIPPSRERLRRVGAGRARGLPGTGGSGGASGSGGPGGTPRRTTDSGAGK